MNNKKWLTIDFNDYINNKDNIRNLISDNNLIIKNFIKCSDFEKDKNLKIKNINLNDSTYYNPLNFMFKDIDVEVFCDYLVIDKLELQKIHSLLLQSLILYLLKYRKEEDHNAECIMKLLRATDINEPYTKRSKSSLDRLFDEVKKMDPNSIAFKKYKLYQNMGYEERVKCANDLMINLSFFELDLFTNNYNYKECIDLNQITNKDSFSIITLEKTNILSFKIIYDLILFQLDYILNNENFWEEYYNNKKNVQENENKNKEHFLSVINDRKNVISKLNMISDEKTSEKRNEILNSIKEEVPNWENFITEIEHDKYCEITPYDLSISNLVKWDKVSGTKFIIVKNNTINDIINTEELLKENKFTFD